MYDPLTQAFELRQFWRKANDWGYKPPLVTIWHRDPEKKGDDDSCDWFGHHILTAQEKEFAATLVDNDFDNLRTFFSTFIPQPCPKHGDNHDDCDMNDSECKWGEFVENCSRDEMKSRIMGIMRCYKREFCWRYPVRWHFWHWHFQIHPVQHFKRWAFSRCCKCGKGFRWGSAVCTNSWNSSGPRWFRSEPDVYHGDCETRSGEPMAAVAVGGK